MGFQDLDIKGEYRNISAKVIDNFYNPTLSESILYQRAVGFFSSTALVEISKGISGLLKNNGKIQLIASPNFSDEDINAIKEGYKLKETVVKDALFRELKEPINEFDSDRLNLVCNLIVQGVLEIKVAVMNTSEGIGMYHEKLGLMYDRENNIIAFTGSMNESKTAFSFNYESIDVYKSWTYDAERVKFKQLAFNSLWKDYEENISVYSFPQLGEELLKRYRTNNRVDLEIDIRESQVNYSTVKEDDLNCPQIPDFLKLFEYQNQAINNWEENNFIGIYDMATGTGKTITALGSIERIYKSKKRLAVVIVCPYKHLVSQWVDDLQNFNIIPIVGYSDSPQKDWYCRLVRSIGLYNGRQENFFCFITTNMTYSSNRVQLELEKIKENGLIVIDEAHNFGAQKLSETLIDNFTFRLALSATLDRHNDVEGTEKLLSYFKTKCISYTLAEAIKNKKLTPYKYYPIVVTLTEEEQQIYNEITQKIIKCSTFDKKGKMIISESGKLLLIKRARLIAGARNKIDALKKAITPYKYNTHMLIYCGAATYNEENIGSLHSSTEDVRQIDAVVSLLGHDLQIKVAKFTSEESMEKRTQIKEALADGDFLQGLVAIRCLDEGVDIPSVKTAFILASSTNPKEYIQRRGRVLRKFPGKEYAEIYDFITLPYYGEDGISEFQQNFKGLAKKELARVKEFSQLAMNSSVSDEMIATIKRLYSIVEGEEIDGTI